MRKLFLLLLFILAISSDAVEADTYRYVWPEDEDLFSRYYAENRFFPVQETRIGSSLESVTSRMRELKIPYEIRHDINGWTTGVSARMDFGAYRNFTSGGGSMYFDEYGYLRYITSGINTKDSFAVLYDAFYSQFGGADRITQTSMDYDTDSETYAEFETTTFALWIQDEVMYELEVLNLGRAEFDVNIWHGRSGREIEIDEPEVFAYLSVYDIRMQDDVLGRYK